MRMLRWAKRRRGGPAGMMAAMAMAAAATVPVTASTADRLSAQEPAVRAFLEPPQVEVGGQFTLKIEVSGASEVEDVVIGLASQLPFARAASTFPYYNASDGVPFPFTTEITAATDQSPGLVTFSYPLVAMEAGFFDIGPLRVTADGRTLETEPAMLFVTSPDDPGYLTARFEPSEVRLMETFRLVVYAPGLDPSLNDVILPDLSGVARQGVAASSFGVIYEFVAVRPGTHEVGPVSVSVGGEVYETEPLTLVVSDEHGAIEVRAALNTDHIREGGEFVLSVEAKGVDKLEEDPILPELSELAELLSGGPSGYSFGNGGFIANARYRFRALRPGDFEIGPIAVTAAGQTFLTEPVRLTITEASPDPFVSPEQLRAIATTERRRVYVGEPVFVSYQVLARDGSGLAEWSVHEATFTPPDHQDFQIHDLGEQRGSRWERVSVDGRAFRGDTRHLVALVPLQSGETTVGPAEFLVQVNTREPFGVRPMRGEEASRASMMGEWTPVILTTDPISVEVLPLPAGGRPESFRGHVGRVAVASWLDRTEAQVGDTVTLRVVMTGNGYLRLMPDPEIILPEGFDVSEPEVSDDPPQRSVGQRGERTLVYRLVPTRAGSYRIPAVEVSWFDPETEEYGVARAEPFDLAVGPAGRE